MDQEARAEGEFRAQRAPDFDVKRARLRDVAARMFAERGVAHTALSDIGRAVGGATSLRHYYPRKELLLADLVTAQATSLVAAVQAASEAKTGKPARLAAIARAYLQAACQGRDAHRVLCTQRHELSASLREDLDVRDGWLRLPIEDALAALRPGAPAIAAATCRLLLDMLDGMAARWHPDQAIDRDAPADAASGMALVGLRTLHHTPAQS